METRKQLAQTVIVLVLLGALRLYSLPRFDIWYDEAISIFETVYWQHIFTGTFVWHPPGYAFFLFLWTQLFKNLILIRLLSFIFGMTTLLLCYLFTTRLFDHRTGFISLILLGTSPFHVYYSKEIRTYPLYGLCYMVVWFMFVLLTQQITRIRASLFIIAWAAVFYTHYFSIFAFVGQVAILLVLRRNASFNKKIIVFLVISGCLFLPWIGKLLWITDRLFVKGDFHANQMTWQTLLELLRIFSAGYEPPMKISNSLALLCSITAIIGGCFHSRIGRNYFLGMLGTPFLICFIAGLILKTHFFWPRYLFFLIIPFMICAALGIRKLGSLSGSIMLSAIVILNCISMFYQFTNTFTRNMAAYGVHPREDFKNATDFIMQRLQPGDKIGHSCVSSSYSFWYYLTFLHKLDPGKVLDIDSHYLHLYDRIYAAPEMYDQYFVDTPINIDSYILEGKRLWFIGSQWEMNDDFAFEAQLRKQLQRYLDVRFPVLLQKEFRGVPITLYDLQRPLTR